jgi:hypothetical protein
MPKVDPQEEQGGAAANVKPKELARPAFPFTEGDDRNKFFVIWSPYQRYLSIQTFNTQADAVKAAKQAADDSPGTDWYVLQAVKFAYKVKGEPIQKDTV